MLRALYLRLRNLRRARLDRDLDAEMRFHIEMAAREKASEGMTLDQARIEAQKSFGNPTVFKEHSRDMFSFVQIETILQDVLFGLRLLRRSPGFTAIAILTLALGIGANTAIFSVVKAVLLDELPFQRPEQLVMLGEVDSGEKRAGTIGYTTAHDWRRLSRSFQSMSLYRTTSGAIVEGGTAELIQGVRVNYDFFETLRIPMSLGRDFVPEEDTPATRRELIIGHGLWVRRFGSDPGIIGRTVKLNDSPYKVVGVLSTDIKDLDIPGAATDPEMFQPLGYALTDPFACRSCQHLHLIGRLKPGVSATQARDELNAIMSGLVRQYPDSYPLTARAVVDPLKPHLVGRIRVALWVVFAAVGFVLLIVCANIANLMLVRASSRFTEIALRAALGASRWRLTRQMLIESLLLSTVGGAAGILIAKSSLAALIRIAPSNMPRTEGIRIDPTVLLIALALSLTTGLLFGLAPAVRAWSLDLTDGLKSVARLGGGRNRAQLTNLLVTAEIVLAFVLAAGAGLLGESFLRLIHVDPGFDSHNIVTLRTYVYGPNYQQAEAELNYYHRALERVRAIPGVQGAAMTSVLPLRDFDRYGFHIRDLKLDRESNAPSADMYSVTPSYFSVMKIPLKRGRFFTESDGPNNPRVAIISESCAREQFPGRDPIGKQIQLGGRDDKKPWITIVGIVGDVRQYGLDIRPRMAAYVAQAQDVSFGYSLIARTTSDPRRIENDLRAALLSVDPTQPVYQMRTLDSYLASSVAQRSFTLTLLIAFGSLAVLLAAMGIYGVISSSVALRTREMGIRMALGAERRDVLRMVLRQGALLAILGLLAGFTLSLGLTRVLSTLLYDVRTLDHATTGIVAALLLTVALVASYLPARRAASVNPMSALRNE